MVNEEVVKASEDDEEKLALKKGAKYLVFFSSCSLKTGEKCISFAQFVFFSREVCLFFNFGKIKIMSKKNIIVNFIIQ